MSSRLLTSSMVVVFFAMTASACSGSSGPGASVGPQSGDVRVTVDGKGFHPATVTFVKGSPASLTFVRTSDETCATDVVFPELKLKKPLALNTPTTIEVPTNEPRTLAFQCGMGMFRSSVIIR